jgi:hypothetical protein
VSRYKKTVPFALLIFWKKQCQGSGNCRWINFTADARSLDLAAVRIVPLRLLGPGRSHPKQAYHELPTSSRAERTVMST